MSMHTTKNIEKRRHSAPLIFLGTALRCCCERPQLYSVGGLCRVSFQPLAVVLIDELFDGAKHDRLLINTDTIGG